jgi:6-phosphogluconolactonase
MTTRSRLKVRVAKDRGELRRLAAELIVRKIESAILTRGVCSMALSGGSTPGPVYEEIGESDLSSKISWPQLRIFFADERAVPMDHPESNYRLVVETLLKSHPEALGQTYRMPADAPDRRQAAKQYGRRLPDPLDLLVLGMGADGHTASLFPGSAALDEREERAVAVTAPKPPPERMTVTPPVLERARTIVMIAAGADKASMVAKALTGVVDPKAIPAQLARRAHWILDSAAASALEG